MSVLLSLSDVPPSKRIEAKRSTLFIVAATATILCFAGLRASSDRFGYMDDAANTMTRISSTAAAEIESGEAALSSDTTPVDFQIIPDRRTLTDEAGKSSIHAPPVQQIILLGERHSGTNWINDHLEDCFNENIKVSPIYTRFKHWFQDDDDSFGNSVPDNSAVVIVLFRDPYDWIEAMREEPHHAHYHVLWHVLGIDHTVGWKKIARPMRWKDFVTKPWIGQRSITDRRLVASGQEATMDGKCVDNYSFADVIPCSGKDSHEVIGLGPYKYELQRDGSERPYSSIIDLRRDKILNHLSVANFKGTQHFFPLRYEDLKANGTEELLAAIERTTGRTRHAKCTAFKPRVQQQKERRLKTGKDNPLHTHKVLPKELIQWMNKFVDWDVENMIGYYKRDV